MRITRENGLYSNELLRKHMGELEQRLAQLGYSKEQVRDWLFHLREMLDEWERSYLKLASIINTENDQALPSLLRSFVSDVLYVSHGHIEWHLQKLEKLFDESLPDEDELTSNDSDNATNLDQDN